MARQGNAAIIEQFLADGIPYMFGNPGTVEQGFLDELENYEDLQYILTLQETVAAGIADGYARATGRPALLQLHSGVGLGNAIGMPQGATMSICFRPLLLAAAVLSPTLGGTPVARRR